MENRTPATTMLLASAVLLILGYFLPWASAGGFSANGGDISLGFMFLLAGGYLGFIGWRKMQRQPITGPLMIGVWVAAVIAGLLALLKMFSSDWQLVSRGIGVYVTLVGGILAVIAAVTLKKEETGATGSTGGTAPPANPF